MNPVRLATKRLVLRELRADDWVEAQRLDRDPRVVRFQSNDVLDEAGTKQYLETSIAAQAASPRLVYDLAICLPDDDRFLGRAGFKIERPEHREAQLWFTLRHDLWGKGFASEVLPALLDFAFDELKLHRVYGDCDPRNVGSARVMERAGMRREGHLRENWWLKGEWCDSLLFAVLNQEWPALRPKGEALQRPSPPRG
ncbi:MAG: GNAT family protein [Archangium sp.]|nr:GNAT family protein [Archangium sp.]MDP3157144.1 GNAT family protein [Archangium sp.]MDP3575861.1 GNAT family protein [Archangium sp.]